LPDIRQGRTTVPANFREALNDPNDDLNKFDSASGGDDLAAFDAATGDPTIPAGWYVCTITRGEAVPTKKGKTAYRLTLDVAEGSHQGYRLWRYFTFGTPLEANRAKLALAPLGLNNSTALRKQFPEPGRLITLKVLVGVENSPEWGKQNRVERFEVIEDRSPPPNPNEIDPDKFAGGEGEQS
jgi:hypothetical protein